MKAFLAVFIFSLTQLVRSIVPPEDTMWVNNCLGCLTANDTYTYCGGTTKKCYQGLSSTCTTTFIDFVNSCGSD